MFNYNGDSFEEKEKQLEDISLFNMNGNWGDDNSEYVNRNIDSIFPTEKDDENLFDKKDQEDNLDFNIYQKSQFEIHFADNSNDKTTKTNTINLKEEKNKEEINEEKKEEIKEDKKVSHSCLNIFNLNELIEKAPEEILLGNKRGRKKKSEKSQKEKKNSSEHNKDSPDNMMRKIKTNLMDWIVIILNDSLNDKSLSIYKIDKSINEYLKRDFNLELMERTIKDIFSNTKISAKYKRNNDDYSNNSIIKEILEKNVETKTIYYLNLRFIDMIDIIRNRHLKEFLENIEKKEKKSDNINIKEYMRSIKELLLGYKEWFDNKKGRNRQKN